MTHWKVCDILKTLQGGTTSKSWLKSQKDSLTIDSIRIMTSNSIRVSDYLIQKETVTIQFKKNWWLLVQYDLVTNVQKERNPN